MRRGGTLGFTGQRSAHLFRKYWMSNFNREKEKGLLPWEQEPRRVHSVSRPFFDRDVGSSILASLSEAGGNDLRQPTSKPLPPHSPVSVDRHLECTLCMTEHARGQPVEKIAGPSIYWRCTGWRGTATSPTPALGTHDRFGRLASRFGKAQRNPAALPTRYSSRSKPLFDQEAQMFAFPGRTCFRPAQTGSVNRVETKPKIPA